jgi:hypothetical protein
MVKDKKSPYDDLNTRCPMLGHLVPFTYCMAPGSELPCRRVLDCWHEKIDIKAYLEDILTPQQMNTITAPPQQKVMQLLDLVQKAKQRIGEGDK